MSQSFLSVGYAPFSLALGLLMALFALELAALLIGGSLFGAGDSDIDVAPELASLEASFDLDAGDLPDVAALTEASDALQALPSTEAGELASPGVLGLGQAPFMIWFAALLLGFGVSGIAAQLVAGAVLGITLPVLVAGPVAAVAGLAFARKFAGTFGRLLPGIETTATSAQFMGGLRGVVSQGVARKGTAAEVRLRDRHGNTHYMRCEPFKAEDIINEGVEVLTLRERDGQGGWRLRIIPIS